MTKDQALRKTEILSERELQVAVGLSNGLMPREVARQYKLSVKTVSTYRARLMEKLALRSNAQLAVLLYVAGKADPL